MGLVYDRSQTSYYIKKYFSTIIFETDDWIRSNNDHFRYPNKNIRSINETIFPPLYKTYRSNPGSQNIVNIRKLSGSDLV